MTHGLSRQTIRSVPCFGCQLWLALPESPTRCSLRTTPGSARGCSQTAAAAAPCPGGNARPGGVARYRDDQRHTEHKNLLFPRNHTTPATFSGLND